MKAYAVGSPQRKLGPAALRMNRQSVRTQNRESLADGAQPEAGQILSIVSRAFELHPVSGREQPVDRSYIRRNGSTGDMTDAVMSSGPDLNSTALLGRVCQREASLAAGTESFHGRRQ